MTQDILCLCFPFFLVQAKNTKEEVPRVCIHISMVPPHEDTSCFWHCCMKDFDTDKHFLFLKLLKIRTQVVSCAVMINQVFSHEG
jgi:hypothetical protein